MVGQKQMVLNWLNRGAIWKDGVLLFRRIFGRNQPFLKLIKKGGSPLKYNVLKQALQLYANRQPNKQDIPQPPKTKLRDDFPFLADADCPPELKILAANKITAYHNYVAGHKALFNCKNPDEQFISVKQTVENYIENRLIIKEFNHYKKNKKILGEHPIFKLFKKIQGYHLLKLVDLVKLSQRLEHNIWRIKSEIESGDKKHLQVDREKRLAEKTLELSKVNQIIADYG